MMTNQAQLQTKPSNRTYRKASDWRKLVEGFEAGNLTIAEYCNEKGIAQSGFYHWRNKFQKEDAADISAENAPFIELPIHNPSRAVPKTSSQWDIELSLGEDTILRIRRD